jgi:hypothetical protein
VASSFEEKPFFCRPHPPAMGKGKLSGRGGLERLATRCSEAKGTLSRVQSLDA